MWQLFCVVELMANIWYMILSHRVMAKFTNTASFCITAPDGAQKTIKAASDIYATDNIGAINMLIQKYPDADNIQQHLHGVLNGSGTVAIQYDVNATNWSVHRLEPSSTTTGVSGMRDAVLQTVAAEMKSDMKKHVVQWMAADARCIVADEHLHEA